MTISRILAAIVKAYAVSLIELTSDRQGLVVVAARHAAIRRCRRAGHSAEAIAVALRRDPSTVRRVLRHSVGDNTASPLRAGNSEAYRLVDEHR